MPLNDSPVTPILVSDSTLVGRVSGADVDVVRGGERVERNTNLVVRLPSTTEWEYGNDMRTSLRGNRCNSDRLGISRGHGGSERDRWAKSE